VQNLRPTPASLLGRHLPGPIQANPNITLTHNRGWGIRPQWWFSRGQVPGGTDVRSRLQNVHTAAEVSDIARQRAEAPYSSTRSPTIVFLSSSAAHRRVRPSVGPSKCVFYLLPRPVIRPSAGPAAAGVSAESYRRNYRQETDTCRPGAGGVAVGVSAGDPL